MNDFILSLTIPLVISAVILFIIAGLIWLFACHGIDKLRHPEEWKDQGSSGERIVYRTLVNQIHVPENQILRNVYIPTADGKTSEIDLLVVSKKGLLVFECKTVTFALLAKSIFAIGFPTILLRPITTAFLPINSIFSSSR